MIMKTMKSFLMLMAMAAVTLSTAFTLTACGGDDDDDNSGGGNTQQSIVGNWDIIEDNNEWFTIDNSSFWNFYKDGTCEYPQIFPVESASSIDDLDFSYASNGFLYRTIFYKWTLSGNVLTMNFLKERIWQDYTFTKVVKENDISYLGSIKYEVEFLDNNRMKLTDSKDKNSWYILKRASGNSTPIEYSKYDERILQQIPEQYLEKLSKYMTVYQGSSPTNVEGVYAYTPEVVFDETKNYPAGEVMAAERVRFSNQNSSRNTLTVEEKYRSGETAKSSSAVIMGSGNNFTIFYFNEGEQSGVKFKTATVISGTKTSDGIKDLHQALMMLEKDETKNTIMPVGYCRVFKEHKSLSEPTTWDN